MAKQINFEVQVMQGGRWTISARFPSTGQELAIEEAKQIDASGIGEVRVLRDVYDSETGMSTEFTVYKSSSAGGDGANYSRSGGGDDDDWDDDDGGSDDDWMRGGGDDDDYDDDDYDDGDDDFDDDDDRPAKKSSKKKGKDGKQTSFTGLLVKLLFAVLLALGLSATTVAVMSPYIEGINFFGMRLTGIAKENALIMTFLVTFLASSIMLAAVLLKNTSLKAKKKAQRRAQAARRPTARPPAGAAKQQAAKQQTPKPSDDTTKLDPMDESGGMEKFREEAADSSEPAPPQEEAKSKEEEEPAKRAIILEAEDMPVVSEDGLSPHAEKQKKYMMGFIDKAMTAVGKDKKSMSNFDKFGVSLFLAGACEALGQNQDVDADALAKIMADSVQTMGFKRSHAKTFADKYEEYLVQDATYMQMFQAGRNAMATYSTDESRIAQNAQAAMTEWNKPKVKEADSGPVTVLFTDIAGSTAMTQNLGDAGAQQVVRAHNRVVREALTMWSGKEVKHTGDGIMASFAKTSDSLDAAMQMQRESAEYTAQNPDKPLHLKIGINAGEPISEDNDLFGSTVQMSARIVDKAQADEIFVSEIVRGICAGKSYKFTSRGTYPMKGFDTDPVLYEVMWKEE